MAAGKLNLQAADGAVIGLVVPDGLTSGERQIALGVNLSGIAAYHLLQGNLAATINANYVEASATTTRNYTTSDYIFDSLNNKLYDCILASTAGALLTNTTYFTSITAGTLSINNALIPLAQGIDSNGAKNTILNKNETITGLTYTQGKNYVYCDKNGAYGVKNVAPIYTDTFSTETTGSVLKGDEYHIIQNRWQSTINTPRGDLVNPSLVNVFGDGSCKALYRFEGNANDESGVYNGTATNLTYSNGIIGQCAVFNGSSSYVSTSTVPDIDSTTAGTYSVSMWMTLNSPINTVPLDIRQKLNVIFNASGILFVNVPVSAGTGYNTLVPYTSSNKMVNVVIVKPAGSNYLNVYFDGVLQNGTNSTLGTYTHITSFNIGRETAARYYYSGQIDQVRLFNKALSEAEVKSLYSLYSYTYDQTNSRNYLNHIVHADNDGGVLYVEELPKTQYFDRIETVNNRKVMYLADYGISQIQNNKRYVLDNPFGNDRYMDCDAKLEILTTEGYWVELSHSQSQNGSGAAYSGAKAFSTQVGIVIQTGLDGFTVNAANCHIVPFAVTNTTLAQARVTIQFNGKTRRTR